MHKQPIRIILNLQWGESVKQHFFKLGIMTVCSSYILELILHEKNESENLCKLGCRHLYNTGNKEKIIFATHILSLF